MTTMTFHCTCSEGNDNCWCLLVERKGLNAFKCNLIHGELDYIINISSYD